MSVLAAPEALEGHECSDRRTTITPALGQVLASVEKKARIAQAHAEEEEQNLMAERKRQHVLQVKVNNAQLQLRPAT